MEREVWVWLIPLLPFAGFVLNAFVGRHLPRRLVGLIACGTVLASFVLGVQVFREVRAHGPFFSESWRWIEMAPISASWRLHLDQLSSVMILVVTGVGSLIHIYSTGYMHGDERYSRFFCFLNLFTGFMLILVTSSNLLLMFVGWEGVGLCSYLLIGFWFEVRENAAAGMKAFVVNRIGDFAFVLGVMTLFFYLGRHGVWTLEFQAMKGVLEHRGAELSAGVLTLVGVLLFGGAAGKSAQLPLYVWLPDAMAGPTPVSALIHAATMVTAGVYMIARMNFLYVLAPGALTVVATVGALTALFAGTIGFAQNDIKKVLAYSTVSQLGFMFLGVGVGAFAAGIFHLVTHAFFKACLFLGAGAVIHGMEKVVGKADAQDIRKMGGLFPHMKWTAVTFIVASLALSGFPLLSGFFSKDSILWKTWEHGGWGRVLWILGASAAFCTAFYMGRLVIKTFFGAPNWGTHPRGAGFWKAGRIEVPTRHDDDQPHPLSTLPPEHAHEEEPHEAPWSMRGVLVVLAVLSVVGGYLAVESWLAPVFRTHEEPLGSHSTEHVFMGISIVIALAGMWAAYRWFYARPESAAEFVQGHRGLYELVRDKYRVDEFYRQTVVQPLLAVDEGLGRFDNGVIDGAVNGLSEEWATTSRQIGTFDNEVVDGGVNASAQAVRAAGRNLRRIQTGNIRHYVAGALMGGLFVVVCFCLYLLVRDKFHA